MFPNHWRSPLTQADANDLELFVCGFQVLNSCEFNWKLNMQAFRVSVIDRKLYIKIRYINIMHLESLLTVKCRFQGFFIPFLNLFLCKCKPKRLISLFMKDPFSDQHLFSFLYFICFVESVNLKVETLCRQPYCHVELLKFVNFLLCIWRFCVFHINE